METTNAIGRRKCAVARVYIKEGTGVILVNGRDYKEYFHVWLNVRNSVRKRPANASSSASANIEIEGSLVSKLPGLPPVAELPGNCDIKECKLINQEIN